MFASIPSFRPVRALLLAAAIVFTLGACDDPATQAAIDEARQQAGIPGMTAAVITSDTITMYTSGVRKLGSPTPVGRNDLFHIGSDGKAMLATVIAREVEAGVMRWNMTIAQAFPELTDFGEYANVTLTNLLQHRSGLPGFETGDEFAEIPELPGTPPQQRLEFVKWVLTRDPAQIPGQGYQYSNAGYAVAAAMLERATGQVYETLMQDLLFRPLGIRPVYELPAQHHRNQPWGHRLVDNVLTPVDPELPENQLPEWTNPVGNISLTTMDFARFVQTHLRGLRGRSNLLTKQMFQTLHTPTGDYAYGWQVLEDRGQVASAHAGSNDTFYALMIIEPGVDAAVVVFSNASGPAIDESVVTLGFKLLPRQIPH